MRRSKPLALVAAAILLTLAACGGSGKDASTTTSGNPTFEGGKAIPKDATRQGPAAEIDGATTGGTINVMLPSDPGPNDLDPSGGWSVTGNSIMQALLERSLTQYSKDPKTGDMILVPDLATDLGTPNEDFTQWKFTIKDNVKWEDGTPITAEQVAFGMSRSLDSTQFPGGPGTEYSVAYFKDADKYKGPYTDKGKTYGGITVEGQDITIDMAKPFPDMDYWGAFPAMGPVPLGNAGKPPAYGLHPLSSGPYKIESYKPNQSLTLVKNDQWDPATDPARHQYADGYTFKFLADPEQTDQIMLSDNEASQSSISTSVLATNYTDLKSALGDRLIQQSALCTSIWDPDYTKIKDINVRKALAYAYPYQDVWLAGGDIPGVTRVPANGLMPPGMPGKSEFQVDGAQITTDVAKAKELLGKAGYADKPYPITMIYQNTDPTLVDAQNQITKGLDAAGFKVTAIQVEDSPYNTWLDPDSALNKKLNLRAMRWCADWPSGLTFVPPLARTGATYNLAQFSEPAVDAQMDEITTLPLDEQAAAWGALDEEIATKYYPIIPTAFSNELFAFGNKIGNPTGDGEMAFINFKDLFVQK